VRAPPACSAAEGVPPPGGTERFVSGTFSYESSFALRLLLGLQDAGRFHKGFGWVMHAPELVRVTVGLRGGVRFGPSRVISAG